MSLPENDPWLTKKDRIPTPTRVTPCNISLGDEYFTREGWFKAAEILANTLIADRLAYPGLMFPMTYCYRHYLELAMKHIPSELAKLTGEPVVELKQDQKHSLLVLWREFRKHSEKAFPGHPDHEAIDDIVEKLIDQLHQFDPRSTAFRYPDRNLRMLNLPRDEIVQLRQTMERLRLYFEGTDVYASELWQMTDVDYDIERGP